MFEPVTNMQAQTFLSNIFEILLGVKATFFIISHPLPHVFPRRATSHPTSSSSSTWATSPTATPWPCAARCRATVPRCWRCPERCRRRRSRWRRGWRPRRWRKPWRRWCRRSRVLSNFFLGKCLQGGPGGPCKNHRGFWRSLTHSSVLYDLMLVI